METTPHSESNGPIDPRSLEGSIKMVLICIDGLSWNLLNRFREEKVLPTFDKIIEHGVSGELKSMFPLVSPRIWATIFTGKDPEKHGVEDFYINSTSIRAEQVWEVLQESGRKVGVFKPLTAFTPNQSYSFFVPGYLSLENDTYPVDLKFFSDFCQELRARASIKISPLSLVIYAYKLFKHGCGLRTLLKAFWAYLILLTSSNLSTQDRLYKLKEVETILNTKVFIYCLKRYSPDFAVFYDNSIDFASHFYWKYVEPELFDNVDREAIERYGERIRKYYILMDEILGRMSSFFGDRSYFMIVSDHGFKTPHKDVTIYTQLDLEMYTRHDFEVNVISLLRLLNLESKVYGIKSAKGGIFRPKDNEIDLEEIEKNLRNVKYKGNGRNIFLVERVASYVKASLDVEALARNQRVILMDSSECSLEDFVDFAPARSGDHSLEGVLIVRGPNIRSAGITRNSSVYDIFPTILAIYKIPIPRDVDGKVLADIFRGDIDLEYVDKPASTEKGNIGSKGLLREEENHIKQRLKDLGYM